MSEIKGIGNAGQGLFDPSKANSKSDSPSNFETAMKDALKDVSDVQNSAEKAIEDFSKGEVKDIHTVVVAMEQADMSLQTMLTVRNKLLSAYDEIMRMQV